MNDIERINRLIKEHISHVYDPQCQAFNIGTLSMAITMYEVPLVKVINMIADELGTEYNVSGTNTLNMHNDPLLRGMLTDTQTFNLTLNKVMRYVLKYYHGSPYALVHALATAYPCVDVDPAK